MLYAGLQYAPRGKFIGAAAQTSGYVSARDRGLSDWFTIARVIGGLNKKTSVPDGYRGSTAYAMAISDGGMMSRSTSGGGVAVADLSALGNLTGPASGIGQITFANLAGGIDISVALAGTCSITSADLRGKAAIIGRIFIGAQPSADDIAEAVINKVISGSTASGTVAEGLKKTLKRDEFLGLS